MSTAIISLKLPRCASSPCLYPMTAIRSLFFKLSLPISLRGVTCSFLRCVNIPFKSQSDSAVLEGFDFVFGGLILDVLFLALLQAYLCSCSFSDPWDHLSVALKCCSIYFKDCSNLHDHRITLCTPCKISLANYEIMSPVDKTYFNERRGQYFINTRKV